MPAANWSRPCSNLLFLGEISIGINNGRLGLGDESLT